MYKIKTKRAAAFFGNYSALGRFFDPPVTPGAVQKWKNAKYLPQHRVDELLERRPELIHLTEGYVDPATVPGKAAA